MALGVPILNPVALRMAKTLWSFDHSECNRVKCVRAWAMLACPTGAADKVGCFGISQR